MNYTFEQIQPLIVHTEEDNNDMYCEFKIPGTEQVVNATVRIKRLNTMTSQVTRVAQRTVTNKARTVASRLIGNILGGGMLGSTARTVFNTAVRSSGVGNGFSQEEQNQAVIDAFQKVSQYFYFDRATGTFTAMPKSEGSFINISNRNQPPIQNQEIGNQYQQKQQQERNPPAESLSEFDRQIGQFPVKTRYDKEILARMLVELANADGNISSEEQQYLAALISPEIGTIEKLLNADPLAPIECQEVSKGVKETIFMLSCAVVHLDLEAGNTELNLLAQFADMFGLSPDVDTNLRRIAKFYVLEQYLEPDTTRNQMFEISSRLKLSDEDALRCQIQWKKRS